MKCDRLDDEMFGVLVQDNDKQRDNGNDEVFLTTVSFHGILTRIGLLPVRSDYKLLDAPRRCLHSH